MVLINEKQFGDVQIDTHIQMRFNIKYKNININSKLT